MSSENVSSKRIIVTLSTGKQGANTVRALSRRNQQAGKNVYTILAVTRDAQSSKAKELATLPGVELLESEYNEKNIFEKATQNGKLSIYGVFSVQQFISLPDHVAKGTEGETQLGKLLADEAKRNNVQHFVYTSVQRGSKDDGKTNVPYFESKRLIEEHIEQIKDFNWTILQPVAFMDNLSNGETSAQRLSNAIFTSVAKKPIQFIAARDIGEFAALAFDQPKKFIGQKIGLANELVTSKEIEKTYKIVKGKSFPKTFGFRARRFVRNNQGYRNMFNFFDTTGYSVKIDKVRELNPNMLSLRQFMESEL